MTATSTSSTMKSMGDLVRSAMADMPLQQEACEFCGQKFYPIGELLGKKLWFDMAFRQSQPVYCCQTRKMFRFGVEKIIKSGPDLDALKRLRKRLSNELIQAQKVAQKEEVDI